MADTAPETLWLEARFGIIPAISLRQAPVEINTASTLLVIDARNHVDIPDRRHTISRNAMGAAFHRSDANAAGKISGGEDKCVGVVEIRSNLANPARREANSYSQPDGDTDYK